MLANLAFVSSLLLFDLQMDSLPVGFEKERVCCQGGQSRVETNVDQDEAHRRAGGFLLRFLFARFRCHCGTECLQRFGVGAGAAFP